MSSANIDIVKLDYKRQETWRYTGRLLHRLPNGLVIEARFNRADTPFHGVMLGNGDRFVETFYTDHWYNIFEMHDREDDHIKGWYCNVCQPAEIDAGRIAYVDLALDLLVYPDGRQLVLDEDEFAALNLPERQKEKALAALAELQQCFQSR